MKRINKIRVNNFKGMIEMTEKGETLIKKIQRILDENEPLTDGAPMIYTPKQAGVREDCNIRTDKWSIENEENEAAARAKEKEDAAKAAAEAEAPKAAEGQTEGGVTEPNPTRDN
nr:MAG TPA: hypothetical protein [Microviridae sp.]